MNEPPSTSPRRRPRFSPRTLIVVITLASFYVGCWAATREFGVRDVAAALEVDAKSTHNLATTDISCPLPFIVGLTQSIGERPDGEHKVWTANYRRHYVWILGLTVRTPVQWEVAVKSDLAVAARLL